MILDSILNNNNIEIVEPETIRRLFPHLSEEDLNYYQAQITAKTCNAPFENFYAFENVVRATNRIIPVVGMIEGAEPKWIWHSCKMIEKLRPDMEMSHEVIEYIKHIFSEDGICFLPSSVKNTEIDLSAWHQVYKAAEYKAENGPFPIEPDSFIDRQALELMKLELYSQNQEIT